MLTENISYGFARNMLGIKPIGISTSIIGIVSGPIFAGVVQLRPPAVNLSNFASPGIAASITLAVSVTLLVTWCTGFSRDDVRRIGFVGIVTLAMA